MKMTRTIGALATLLLLPLGACAEGRPPITLDGSTRDWPAAASMVVEPEHLFIRFSPPGEPFTIQAGQRTTRILIDADADATTGRRDGELGVDLVVQTSPWNQRSGFGVGASARAYGSNGRRIDLSHAEVGFIFTPTYAASQYEARLSRIISDDFRRKLGRTIRTIESTQRIRAEVRQVDWEQRTTWSSGVMEADAVPSGVAPAAGVLPGKASGAVRVVSHNVLRNSPETDPDPFVRMYEALEPDVILVQEWYGWDSARFEAWFNERLPVEGGWRAVTHESDRAGVAVITRLEVREGLTQSVTPEGAEWPTRFVGAVLETDAGAMLVGSMHLKCCGSAGSPEDERRMRETAAISAFVSEAMDTRAIELCALAGDLNLVGSRPPLDVLRGGLDADGSDLEPAEARVIGDLAYHTWRDDRSLFTPGRLDWIVYSDSALTGETSFVLETEGLSGAELKRAGLERRDSRVSDHLPVVVDLAPRE